MMTSMNKQQAQVDAARETLYQLIKDSPYSFKWVATQIGERNDTLSTRLRHGHKPGYQTLDTALVVNILGVLEVPLTDFFTRVEERSEEILRQS